jgi:chemotaxis response regulator CheB
MGVRAVVAGVRTAVREALTKVIAETGVTVCGAATTEQELVEACDRFNPDLIFVDTSDKSFDVFRVFGPRRLRVFVISDDERLDKSETLQVPVTVWTSNSSTFDLREEIRRIIASEGT